MPQEYNYNIEDILAFLDIPTCDHPGCHELHGSDRILDELRGTRFENRRSEFVQDCLDKADSDPRPAMKVALLDLAEATICDRGAREAFRHVRVASIHSLPEHFGLTIL